MQGRDIRNKATFITKTGLSYPTASRFLNNHVARISIKNLTRICTAINCTPNELFTYYPGEIENLAPDHVLNSLIPQTPTPNLIQELQDLSISKINRLGQYLKQLKQQP